MADVIDQANQVAERDLQLTLSNATKYEGESATHCEECDEPIPEARRKALPGVKLCVDCQDLVENRRPQ